MGRQPLFDKLDERIARDKEEGDIAYFRSLMLKIEYLTKIITTGIISCIGDEVDRHRYSLEHQLIRADSIGKWVKALNTALVGAPAQFLISDARNLARDLTEKIGPGDWRHTAVNQLNQAASEVGVESKLSTKLSLRQFFDIGAQLRNRSFGHGAPTSGQCSKACENLDACIALLINNIEIFRLSWVHLHRNLSGKYKVSPLLNDPTPFEYLKKTRDVRLQDGVFFYLDSQYDTTPPLHIPLIYTDPDLLDISLPNGNYKLGNFELLSYVTNDVRQQDGSAWQDPPTRLPPSETEGGTGLDPLGNTFANLPSTPIGYVSRDDLEKRLLEELLKPESHPIISLTGPGGIGKTTIAITAIQKISQLEPVPYDVILWISARDIDLLDSGPKPVSARVFTQKDISRAAVELLEPPDRSSPNFEPISFFQHCLIYGAAGTTLFVLDNFETLKSTADIFKWIDTYIRPPNKILITTRFRDFVGDYPIEISGMSDEEANKLIDQHAIRLNINNLLTRNYKKELIQESDGHPYVMKILLGQVAKEQKALKPKRIVATADHLLTALFKRTYAALSPAGQRVFLLLCSWRVFVPEVAVEAVSLRPGTERFDVSEALAELSRFSLIEHSVSEKDDERFVSVTLAASIYGQRELEVSHLKAAVQEDRKLLMEFGAGKRGDAQRGVLPRIDNLIKAVAVRASTSPTDLEEALPVLEYLASRFPKAYLQLAELVMEIDHNKEAIERAKTYIKSFLETAEISERLGAWIELARICRLSDDHVGEIHALCEAALLPTVETQTLGQYANSLNIRISELRERDVTIVQFGEVREFLMKVIDIMERRLNELSATDCSRLAWLHLHVGSTNRSLDIAKIGIGQDPANEYCLKLISRLEQ